MSEGKDRGGGESPNVSVVVVPLPAQGHLNQLLHLSLLLAARNISVHYVGSTTHNRQACERAAARPLGNRFFRFHDFPVPSFPSPPPDPYADVKFPAHMQPAFDAALHLEEPLAALLLSLAASSRRVVVIHDSTMSFAASVGAALPNVESFSFHSVSAFAVLLYQWEARGCRLLDVPFIAQHDLPNMASGEGCFTPEFLDFLRRQHRMTTADAGRLLNSCSEIEGKFIELLKEEPYWREQMTFAIGPLNPLAIPNGIAGHRHECLTWLDQQPPASVIYVSFGTTSSLSDEQVAELAAGLDASKQRFIWVLRDADRADIYAAESDHRSVEGGRRKHELPLDYEKRVGDRGMVVRGWAPQLGILAHPATGGFMSHCGWNSCMESISMGVPILAWPMHSDQPRNTILVAHLLGTALVVSDWTKRKEFVPAPAIRDSILKLMASEEGKEVRNTAKAVGSVVRRAMMEGGSSKANLDAFFAHVTR